MTYFPDLSPYSYYDRVEWPDAYNIGWLDADHEFTRGPVPPELCAKLIAMALRPPVHQMRGYHHCELCSDRDASGTQRAATPSLGSAELWIPTCDGRGWYAAPDLLIHYIQQHGYQPPQPFLEALALLDLDTWAPPEVRDHE
jgi:hypothetical protein